MADRIVDPDARRLPRHAPPTLAEAQDIVGCYRLRWRIEQSFRMLKRDGMELEDSQTIAEKLRKQIEQRGIFTYMIALPLDELSGFSLFRDGLEAIS